MKVIRFVLPALALGLAGLLIVPGQESYGFSKIGGNLGIAQRDFRVFNNFVDAPANDNVLPSSSWPGWDGAEMAIWKGHQEWGSSPHGPDSNDSSQPTIGDGGADFDGAWMGSAPGPGNTNHNIVSTISSCGGGTLAFTETPISNGWRIRFCENWVWADGPNGIGFSQFDIQGVACHEYGHALGLGHSNVLGATMRPATSAGAVGPRSINGDDMAGVQCIYGVKTTATKPEILATEAVGGNLNIYGENFTGPELYHVWFTNSAVTLVGDDPRVRVFDNAAVTPNLITVPIPAGAGPGSVLVQRAGTATFDKLSNAFPSDLVGTVGDASFQNVTLAKELGNDPTLLDTGGNSTRGPNINDPVEGFNMSLNCVNAGSAGVYTIVLRLNQLSTPTMTNFGFLWHNGPKLFKCSGGHVQNVVQCFPSALTLPNEPTFFGIEYTAQGFCDGSNARLSNAIVQVIGF